MPERMHQDDALRVAVHKPSHERLVAAGRLAFHRCPPDPSCLHCRADSAAVPFDWSFLDAAYCISLQSRDDRAAEAAAEFHRVGLCRIVVFCRPVKEDRTAKKNIWRSHRFVAQHARGRRASRVLVMEDDVVFERDLTPARLAQVAAAMSRLPRDWRGFYLGHLPVWSYSVAPNVVRTSSLCTHAFIAHRRLIRWICKHPPRLDRNERPTLRERISGAGIDAAFATLPGMYAFHPMIAFQRESPNDHVMRGYERGEWSRYALVKPVREYVVTHHLRTAERLARLLSPIARRVVERGAPKA